MERHANYALVGIVSMAIFVGLIAFVVVCLGGFGSVPGALIAGLGIGVIEALSAYLIGAVYQDVVVYALFLGVLWVRPQGLLGTN